MLCLLIWQLPMTLSTTDGSSANCMTWRKTSIWQSWSNCFWKTDASIYVALSGKQSRWRTQWNGLLQGSVLAPVLFNSYTNDQPVSPGTMSFIYADDLGIAVQNRNVDFIEATLSTTLQNLTKYYKHNRLKANPAKTQVSPFHLRSCEVGRKLSLTCNDVNLKHCDFPVYLRVTLDRTLSYKHWKRERKSENKEQPHP